MSGYAITQVHIDALIDEVTGVKIHRLESSDTYFTGYGFSSGGAMTPLDVASLISSGNTVYVLDIGAHGGYLNTDKVRLKPGQQEYIESYDTSGKTTDGLSRLPHF